MEWVRVANVTNDIEYNLVSGVLAMANIPTVKKLNSADGYLTIFTGSSSVEGIDVLVPSDRYEEAVNLLNAEAQKEE